MFYDTPGDVFTEAADKAMFESCAVFWEIMIDSGSSGGNCLKPPNSREVAVTHRSQTFNWIFIESELCPNWWRCWLYLIDLKFVKLNETLVSEISSHEFFIIKPDVCLAKEKMAAGCRGCSAWLTTRLFVWESERRIFEELVNLELYSLLDNDVFGAMVKLQTN